jgi:ubiquinone/menaquinone biosynthesis C-methylase UbiE
MEADPRQKAKWRKGWDKQAPTYDRSMGRFDRWLFADTRAWICSRATGDVLEVAVGTGLNLPHYPAGIRLTGVDVSPAMLALARKRADDLSMSVQLRLGDAEDLGLPDQSFDTVVCTFGLCAIPDYQTAIGEMIAALRPGGLLLLADHIPSTNPLLRAGQWLAEHISIPAAGEHFLRRPLLDVKAAGLSIEANQRFKAGVVERLAARRPDTPAA